MYPDSLDPNFLTFIGVLLDIQTSILLLAAGVACVAVIEAVRLLLEIRQARVRKPEDRRYEVITRRRLS